jgi:BirA family transcriptional regulator, biotin operon repressor / biotin---[acetyl-CoA-carboxylase] ligase
LELLENRIKMLSSSGGDIPWHDLDEISSTMDYSSELVNNGSRSWTVVSALVQTKGRGTKGRSWSSLRAKGLWASIIMPPPLDLWKMTGLTVEAAKALAETIHELTGAPCEIKDPNDILIRGRKAAGILIETVIRGEEILSVILGMGVNISLTEVDFREAGLPDATSLFLETGSTPDRETILTSFLNRFRPKYESMTG